MRLSFSSRPRPSVLPVLRPLAASLALMLAGAATQAASVFDLRVIDAQADWTTEPDDATLRFRDRFDNLNAQTVAAPDGYSGGPVTPTPLYTLQGTTAGAESSPGDLNTGIGMLGRLRFSSANAEASLLTVNGIAYDDLSNRIRVNNPLTTTPLLDATHRNFAINSAWMLVTPDANSRYGMRLTDAAGGSFDDLISLDIIRLADGSAGAQMRRISGDGLGNRTINDVQTQSLSAVLGPGFDFTQVSVMSMHMYWSADDRRVVGEVILHHLANDGSSGTDLGTLTFDHGYEIFHGETTTSMQVGASWTAPVPEPTSWALMLAGLGGIATLARRRRS